MDNIKNAKIIPVILSGGSGTRLWPLTRESQPKQFLPLLGDLSLIQGTLDRVLTCTNATAEEVITVTSDDLLKETHQQYRTFEPGASKNVIGEPTPRNTAAAVAYAAFHAAHHFGEDAIMWIVPADHHIGNLRAMMKVLDNAVNAAQDGMIATFGIMPASPETGYGYIQQGDASDKENCFEIKRFVEKPNKEDAQSYLDQGDYFWNSGMFVASAKTLIAEFEAFTPDIFSILNTHFSSEKVSRTISPEIYNAIPKMPFDVAVMEQTKRAVVVPCDINWSDIGTWNMLWEIGDKDENGNVMDGKIAAIGTSDCIIKAQSKLVATIGVKDLAIIESGDTILVADKNDSDSLKKVVSALGKEGAREVKKSPFKTKPWGMVKTLSYTPTHKVKEITMNAGESTSLHLHRHRSEMITVITGEAKVMIGDEMVMISAGESAKIPMNTESRVANVGQTELSFIEVSYGNYMGEDDIVRLDDNYGRSAA